MNNADNAVSAAIAGNAPSEVSPLNTDKAASEVGNRLTPGWRSVPARVNRPTGRLVICIRSNDFAAKPLSDDLQRRIRKPYPQLLLWSVYENHRRMADFSKGRTYRSKLTFLVGGPLAGPEQIGGFCAYSFLIKEFEEIKGERKM
jgi:hypothetical protein